MGESLLRWPYPAEARAGYWGPVSATIDWCEENYVVSSHVAEFANTMTNLAFAGLGVAALRAVRRNGLERRFVVMALGYTLVGVGSFWFHMTLQYRWQLMDELPMILAICVPFWSLVCETCECWLGRALRPAEQAALAFPQAAAVAAVVYVYLAMRNATIHQFLFGFLLVSVALMAGLLAHTRVHDEAHSRNLRDPMRIGVVSFVLGFFFWQLDIHFCSLWIWTRRSILQLPLGLLWEMHSWWHLLTGVGIYYFFMFFTYLRIITTGRSDEFVFIWKWRLWPAIELRQNMKYVKSSYSLFYKGKYEKVGIE